MKTRIRQVKFVLTAALLCATSFAFGDTASNASFEATPAVSNLVKKLSWCSLGTSITDFNDNPITGRTQGYQFFTMDKLGWSHDKLLNVGHSGSTIGVANDFPKDTPYDIYTIEFGVNDWAKGHIVGTMNDYDNYLYNNKTVRYHKFAACYRNVIETIRTANPNAAIVLTTPRKAYGSDGNVNVSGFPRTCDGLTLESQLTKTTFWDPETNTYPDEQTHLADYAELIRQIAAQENLVLCDWYAEAATEENLAALSVDVAVHPNDAGYEIMADLLAPKILEAVSRIDFCKDGHNWGEWIVTKEASESEAGLQHRTCQRCGEEEEVVIPKIVHIVALRNVAVATAVGSAPALPATVKGLFANGAVSDGDYAVAWDEAAAPSEEGVTTVSGTATVEGKSMSVTAFVRAEKPSSGGAELVNIAQCASSMIVTAPGFDGDVGSTTGITNGIPSNVPLNTWWNPLDTRWVNWNSRAKTPDVNVDFTWSSAQKVSKVFLGIFDGNQEPDSVAIMSGEVNLEEVEGCTKYASNKNGYTYYKFNQSHGYLYVFATPIEISSLKVMVTMKGGVAATNIYVGFNQIEVWAEDSSGPAIEPLTTDTLSTLEVDGVAVDGFAPTTYNYEVQGAEAITAATATDNMGITILPKYDGAAYAVTLAEDGESTQTYVVSMPAKETCPHAVTTVTGEIAATCTTAGSTGKETCDECGKVIHEAEVIPMLGHDWTAWEVTKYPTVEEAGSKHRECRRVECDAVEDEELPRLKPFVALRNIAGVAGVGRAFTLPTTVKGIDANGVLTDDLDVVWPSATVAYDAPGLYTVEGYAGADPTKKVTATIRVVPIEFSYKNITKAATITTSDPQGNVSNLGNDAPSDDAADWATANRNKGDVVDTLKWSSQVTVSKVRVCYSGDNNHFPPTSYKFCSDEAEQNEISFKQGEVEVAGVNRWVEFTFDHPVALTTLCCRFGGTGSWLIIERIWVLESEGEAEIVPSSNAALSDLKVDDKTVIDFDPETTEYTAYNGKAITAATAEDNVVVTILPKNEDDNAFVITMAEDGIATKTYTVAMPTVNIAALRNVALVVSVDMALPLPNTVMALTPAGELIGEMPVEWIDAPSSYATAGEYTVMGRAKADASLTVTASVRVLAGENVGVSNAAREGQVDAYIIQPSGDPEQHKSRAFLTDGLIPDTPDWNSRVYSRPNLGTTKCDMEVTLAFQQLEQIEKVCVYYEVGSYVVASGVKFYDANGNEIAYSAPNVSDYSANVKKCEYVFAKPQILPSLKMVFSNADQKFISLIETEAWTTGMLVPDLTPSSNAKPTAITSNGVAVKDFDPDNIEKIWKITSRKNIAIASDDNIAVTVLPEDANRIIRIVTVSEDGLSTKTYKLQLANGFILFVL